ncbi:hypothetical protein AT864_01627 [Anoxybacillus sp. P3H1B]|jgi:membrane-associated HD superfamily phosphohydrolase|nr:hypothetical protein AT864_01627 [Anoxybacillus sp. P3H1B]
MMVYIMSFCYILNVVFLCLAAATFFSLHKAKMYPPKRILQQRLLLYILVAVFSFLLAWSLQHFL